MCPDHNLSNRRVRMSGTKVLFQPFSSSVGVDFWFKLAEKKIEEFKLSESPVPIFGQYNSSQFSTSQETQASEGVVQLPNLFQLSSTSLQPQNSEGQQSKINNFSPGTLYNTNTVESFASIDKKILFDRVASQVCLGVK